MIAVALPDIVDDFDSSIGTVGWLVTSYLLALAVVQPVAGKLGDRHGRRPFIIGGLAIFGIASLGAALSPSLPFLIGFRVAQAVSGAVVFPNGAGLIRGVPANRRGGAFGTGGSIALAAGLGSSIGGALVGVGGWRAIFLVNVPVCRGGPRDRPGGPFPAPGDRAGDARSTGLEPPFSLQSSEDRLALVVESVHAPLAFAPELPILARPRRSSSCAVNCGTRTPCSSRASSGFAPSPRRTRESPRATSPSTPSCSRRHSFSRDSSNGRACRSGSRSRCSPRPWSSFLRSVRTPRRSIRSEAALRRGLRGSHGRSRSTCGRTRPEYATLCCRASS